jgi:iron complex outermembrane receptor protein
MISQKILDNLQFSWNISYQDRYGESIGFDSEAGNYFARQYKPYWLIDGTLKWNFRYLQLFTEVSNILNTRYIDAGSALQPGRWFKAGVVVKFKI